MIEPPTGFTSLAALAVNTVGVAVGVAGIDILNAQPKGRAVYFRGLEPQVVEPLAGDSYDELAALNDAVWAAGHGVSANGRHGILYGGGFMTDVATLARTGATTSIEAVTGVTNAGVVVGDGDSGTPVALAPTVAVEVQNLIAIFSLFDVPDPAFDDVLARLRYDVAYGRKARACASLDGIREGASQPQDLQVFLVPVIDAIAGSMEC